MRLTTYYFAIGMFMAGMSIAASIATMGDPAPGWFAPAAALVACIGFALAWRTYR